MKNFIPFSLIFLGVFSILFFTSCNCNCDAKKEISKAEMAAKGTFYTTVLNVKEDTFDLKLGNHVYKMHKVSRDSISFGPEEQARESLTEAPRHRGGTTTTGGTSATTTGGGTAPVKCTSSYFAGTDRKDPKTSLFTGTSTTFNTVDELLATLPSDDAMKNHNPVITKDPTSGRVKEEDRNVILTSAFLYGIYREGDNDFHIIVGNGKMGGPDMKLINVECSGLPPKGSSSYVDLNDARNVIIGHFGDISCQSTAFKPVGQPIPVTIEGSLFFDVDHAAGVVGFNSNGISFHPQTAWEIHPIAKIEFN